MPSPLNESVTKSREYSAWSGSLSDLKRLLRTVEQSFSGLIEPHVEAKTEPVKRRIAMIKERIASREASLRTMSNQVSALGVSDSVTALESDLGRWEDRLAETESEARLDAQIELQLTSSHEETRTVVGTADDLTDWLEGRTISSLQFSAPAGDIRNHKITLRGSRQGGLSLLVSSRDPQWASAAFADLTAEAAARQPGWRILRNVWLLMALYGVTLFFTLWNVGNMIAKLTTETGRFPSEVGNTAWYILLTLVLTLAPLGVLWTRRAIPAFEVVPTGSKSRGRAALTVIGTSLGAIALGVIGNLVTTWLTAAPPR